jgi:hypothetical protein
MTSFTNDNLWMSGDCLMYHVYGESPRFIARFKYGKRGLGSFKKFLKQNFTMEEYFAEMDKGIPPLRILQSKGYVSPQMKRLSKLSGIPATSEGLERYIQQVR